MERALKQVVDMELASAMVLELVCVVVSNFMFYVVLVMAGA